VREPADAAHPALVLIMKIKVPWFNVKLTTHDPDKGAPADGTWQRSMGPLPFKLRRPSADGDPPRPHAVLPRLTLGDTGVDFREMLGFPASDTSLDTASAAPDVAPDTGLPAFAAAPRPYDASLRPAPSEILRWPTLGTAAFDRQVRAAFAVLRGTARGQRDAVRTARTLRPMAEAVADVLPRLAPAVDRNNAMRWLDAYLSLGRKHASTDPGSRAAAMSQQAPVWEKLLGRMEELRSDRTLQYAILYRLLRETDPPPGGPVQAELVAPLVGVRKQLEALARRSDANGPVLGQNTRDIVRLLLQRLAPAGHASTLAAAEAPAPGSLDEAIASLPPLSADEQALFAGDLLETIQRLEAAPRSDQGLRAALLYSLGKHLPGLKPMYFDEPGQLVTFRQDFPGEKSHLFGLVSRGENHANGVITKLSPAASRNAPFALWFLDPTSGGYNALLETEHFMMKLNPDSGKILGLVTAAGVQEDGSSCGVMLMTMVAQSFRHFEQTDATLDQLLGERRIGNSYVPPTNRHLQFIVGPDLLPTLVADHFKHMQDKDEHGKLEGTLRDCEDARRTIVNKRGMTVQARYTSPGNLERRETPKGWKTFGLSAGRTLERWIARAISDLRELQQQPDGGASAWRDACTRMAPHRLADGCLTDRLVGIKRHEQAHQDLREVIASVNRRLKEYEPNSETGTSVLGKTLWHYLGWE
jgi:hypothetical protein